MKSLEWSIAAAAALLLTAALPATAEPEKEPLITDRPDITESSSVVGPGRFQIETGVLRDYRSNGRSDERGLSTPTLLRLGLNRRWEARLETDGYSRVRSYSPGSGVQRTTGYAQLAPGLKYHIQDPREGSMRPSLGVIGHLNVPSASSDFRSRKLTGDVKLAADWDLAPKWSLGANAGILINEDDTSEVFTSGLLTTTLGRELTERLRSFIEVVVQSPERAGGSTALIVDGGFTYLVNADTQLDVAVGTGLAGRTAADMFWTLGFSRRF
ncbi:MAG: hypothetical protein K0Q72_242 [Armatimonadetes bacterium]|jgi:hypothetical protein|nr:hypothetical protein [Armatimonadota bacterium]